MTQPLILSGSSIAAFWRCPQKWAYEYIERRPHSSSIRQVIGVSTHKAAEVNFERKIETEVDEPLDVILDVFSTTYDAGLDDVEVAEEPVGPAKDSGAGLVRLFHRDVAPPIKPLWVERPIQYTIAGIPFSGYIDLVARTPQGMQVRDLKTTTRAPSMPAYSMQMIGYALGYRQATGEKEADTILDFLIRRKPTSKVPREYQPISWGGPISDSAIGGFAKQVKTAHTMIEQGLFPATGIQNYACGGCPFIDICPAWRGRNKPKDPLEILDPL